MRHGKIACVIPAYNEEGRIGKTIRKVKPYCGCIVVVDDGSMDGTAKEASAEFVHILFHRVRCGVGEALKTGFKEVLKFRDIEYVVTIDADGQHNPDEIPKMLKPLLKMEADIVIGSRLLGDASTMPVHRLIANKILSWLTSRICGLKITDSQSGFRAYNRQAVEKLLGSHLKGYSWASSMIIDAVRKDLRVKEVPIQTIYLKGRKGANLEVMLEILFFLLRKALLEP